MTIKITVYEYIYTVLEQITDECSSQLFFVVSEQIGVDVMNNLQRDREVIERARERVSPQIFQGSNFQLICTCNLSLSGVVVQISFCCFNTCETHVTKSMHFCQFQTRGTDKNLSKSSRILTGMMRRYSVEFS